MAIRLLKANEIDCRVHIVNEKGCSILLYKDARVDMTILDEVFGIGGWKRTHQLIGDRLYCTVSIYDTDTGEWIDKQDVGIESYAEKEKGQASDSFKRACFNVGIGRELYTAPFIWIRNEGDFMKGNNGKYYTNSKFHVEEIGYNDNREIVSLLIKDNQGRTRYQLGKVTPQKSSPSKAKSPTKKQLLDDILELANVKEISMDLITQLITDKFGKESKDLSLKELEQLKQILSEQ